MRHERVRVCAGAVLSAVLVLVLCACGGSDTIRRAGASTSGSVPGGGSSAGGGDRDGGDAGDGGTNAYAVADPGKLHPPLLPADVLVTSSRTIPDSVRDAVRGVRGVDAAMPLSLASLSVNGRTLSIAAVDAGQFRRFTPLPSASADDVWSRVAGGEVAVDPSLPRRLEQPKGYPRCTSAPTPRWSSRSPRS